MKAHLSEASVKAQLSEAWVEGDLSRRWPQSVQTESLKWNFLRCRTQPNSTLCRVHSCLQHQRCAKVSSTFIEYPPDIKLSHQLSKFTFFQVVSPLVWPPPAPVVSTHSRCGESNLGSLLSLQPSATKTKRKNFDMRTRWKWWKKIKPAHWHRGYHVAAPAGWRTEHVASFSALPGPPGFLHKIG